MDKNFLNIIWLPLMLFSTLLVGMMVFGETIQITHPNEDVDVVYIISHAFTQHPSKNNH